ncbi:MAG: hypothetical protein WBZ36_09415 [Candidatus Nitrosopolaris sp.]
MTKLTEQEELRASLGVPQVFLANIERLNEDRFSRYFCSKCNREYTGCPRIGYENPNEGIRGGYNPY